MTYGVQVLDGSGNVVFDMGTRGAVFLETFDVPASGSAVVRTYPSAAGLSLIFAPCGQAAYSGGPEGDPKSLAYVALDTSLGYPRLTATPAGRASTVYVFAQ